MPTNDEILAEVKSLTDRLQALEDQFQEFRRVRKRFRLRTLLVLTLIVSIPLAWIGYHIRKARQYRAAVTRLIECGCRVEFDEKTILPQWMLSIDNNPVRYVVDVATVGNTRLADENMANLKMFQETLIHLDLSDTDITGIGLVHLRGCKNLRTLGLRGTKVDDASLANLQDMRQLHELDLSFTKVGDQGLANLPDHRGVGPDNPIGGEIGGQYIGPRSGGLIRLDLTNTPVTSAGLQHLDKFPNLDVLELRETQITDDGLAKLKGPINAREISLAKTAVGDRGVASLIRSSRYERLDLSETQITDKVMPLLCEASYDTLILDGTRISDTGIACFSNRVNETWLSTLQLNNTLVTNAGLEHLQGLLNLTSLELRATAVTEVGFKHFHDLPALYSLHLPRPHISRKSVAALQKALPDTEVGCYWDESQSPDWPYKDKVPPMVAEMTTTSKWGGKAYVYRFDTKDKTKNWLVHLPTSAFNSSASFYFLKSLDIDRLGPHYRIAVGNSPMGIDELLDAVLAKHGIDKTASAAEQEKALSRMPEVRRAGLQILLNRK